MRAIEGAARVPRTNAQPAARAAKGPAATGTADRAVRNARLDERARWAAMMAHGIRTHCVVEAGRLAVDSGVPAPDAIKTVNASTHAGRTDEARKRNALTTRATAIYSKLIGGRTGGVGRALP